MEPEVHHSLGDILLGHFGVFLDLGTVDNELVAAFLQLLVVQDRVVLR